MLTPDRPAILVGHDWGGIAGWALARENPELLARLVIINAPHPAIFHRELKRSWAQRLASSYAGFFQLRWIAEQAVTAFDYAAMRNMIFRRKSKPENFPHDLRAKYRDAWRIPSARAAALNSYRNLKALKRVRDDCMSWKIHVPTLLLWGDQDPALLRGNLIGLDEFVPQLTVRRHASATHWLAHEEAEWVNANVRKFLSGS